jgi:hypothetical protein
MTRADVPRFGTIIAALSLATRGDVDEPTIELYFRALIDVPINLLDQAAVELAATAKWMPKPAEWREAVDALLDRRQRLQALGPSTQLALPGEVGEYRCEDCDNTGRVSVEVVCEKGESCGRYKVQPHSHSYSRRCDNRYCVEARNQKAAAARRYARSRE